ncbi:MAG: BTAD domain-containing putative transcriptional regulator [Burkholderiales bacterium]
MPESLCDESAKSPRRTLALLQVLIAHGARDVSESTLHEALWPDLEGDDAHRAFEAALHRLRRLLGDSDAIVQKAGSLTIDSSKCWIDANAFEWWDRRASDCPRAERCALSLYRGAFLPGESAGWALQARERLRDKFVRIVAKAAACRESSGAWEEAGALFQRGLDTDPLIEPFYQGLMRCHARQARTTEVARVYRRMRETFSVILGVTPSPVSDRIFRETVYPEERHG